MLFVLVNKRELACEESGAARDVAFEEAVHRNNKLVEDGFVIDSAHRCQPISGSISIWPTCFRGLLLEDQFTQFFGGYLVSFVVGWFDGWKLRDFCVRMQCENCGVLLLV